MKELLKETIKAEEELLAQYKKELNDLYKRKGISKEMFVAEIISAISMLENSIKDKEAAITNYYSQLRECEEE